MSSNSTVYRPLIGLTSDVGISSSGRPRTMCGMTYQDAIIAAGGIPILMTPRLELIQHYLDLVDAVILTGGDDVDVRPLGGELHPKAEVMHPIRQAFDLALVAALDARQQLPALGICLGMQLMGVHHGGPAALIQHIPDEPGFDQFSAAAHANDNHHPVPGSAPTAKHAIEPGTVASYHHQGIRGDRKLGPLVVTVRSDDGMVEAIEDPNRPFYLGVQWHPERTQHPALGLGIIARLVEAARQAESV